MGCTCEDKTGPEHSYMPSHWVPHATDPEEVIQRHVTFAKAESERVRQDIDCQLSIHYGPEKRQTLDIYGANSLPNDSPVFVYIHGGYWQALSKEESAYAVRPLVSNKVIVIVLDYTLAPEATLVDMRNEMGSAGSFILDWTFSRRTRSVTLIGHSAGAHLAAMMLTSRQVIEHKNKPALKSAFLISGLYNLLPLLTTSVNEPLKMNEEEAAKNSPAEKIEEWATWKQGIKIHVVVAEHDPPKFLTEQSKPFYEKLTELGVSCELTVVPHTDHFTVVEKLYSGDYELTQSLVKSIHE